MPSRSKKTRKVGLIGVRKDPDRKPRTAIQQSKKKGKGKPSGTRNTQEQQTGGGASRKLNTDPRHGSKKPIQLVPSETRKFANPTDELAALEADAKLMQLLDKIDAEKPVSKAEQRYVDDKLERHRMLCELLGIEPEEDIEDDEEDPLDKLDAINMDEFKK